MYETYGETTQLLVNRGAPRKKLLVTPIPNAVVLDVEELVEKPFEETEVALKCEN